MNRRSFFASLFAAPLAKYWKPKKVGWHESPYIPVHVTGVFQVGDIIAIGSSPRPDKSIGSARTYVVTGKTKSGYDLKQLKDELGRPCTPKNPSCPVPSSF